MLFAGGLFVGGCGHPATKEECDEILNKVIDLELKDRKNEGTQLEKRKAEVKQAREADLMSKCLNKRVTDSAMQCIRTATSVDQITQQCLH